MWSQYNIETLKPLQSVRRFDDSRGNRFYYYLSSEGDIVISAGITSVLGLVSTERRAIDEWKKKHDDWERLLRAAAEYGTLLHEVYAGIMLGIGVDPVKLEGLRRVATESGSSYDMASKDILSFLKFKEDVALEPLVIEGVLTWTDDDGQSLAMTIDLLARIKSYETVTEEQQVGVYTRGANKGKPKIVVNKTRKETTKVVLIDFKSNFFEKEKKGFYESHKMQLYAAKLAVEQNFDIKVDELYNYAGVAWRTTPSYTLFKQEETIEDWNVFIHYWNLAKAKRLNIPSGRILVTGDFKNSNDYKYYSYPEYVKEILLSEEEKKMVKSVAIEDDMSSDSTSNSDYVETD